MGPRGCDLSLYPFVISDANVHVPYPLHMSRVWGMANLIEDLLGIFLSGCPFSHTLVAADSSTRQRDARKV